MTSLAEGEVKVVEHWATGDNKHQIYLLMPSTGDWIEYLYWDDGEWLTDTMTQYAFKAWCKNHKCYRVDK